MQLDGVEIKGEKGRDTDVCRGDRNDNEQNKGKDHKHDHLVVIKVDGHPKHLKAEVYIVAALKELVGVSADRELDILMDGVFQPLEDNAEITICGHEVFVSHVRTGGSS